MKRYFNKFYKLIFLNFSLIVIFTSALTFATSNFQSSSLCGDLLQDPLSILEPSRKSEVKTKPNIRVNLPYPQTPGFWTQLIELPELMIEQTPIEQGIQNISLGWTESADVIPAKTFVESWHGIIRKIRGYYIFLEFTSEWDKNRFIKNHSINPLAMEGKVEDISSTFFLMIEVKDLSVLLKPITQSNVMETTEAALLALSNNQVPIKGSKNHVIYYFLDRKPIGYKKNNKFFKIIYEEENIASHKAIVRNTLRVKNSGEMSQQELLHTTNKQTKDVIKKLPIFKNEITKAAQALKEQNTSIPKALARLAQKNSAARLGETSSLSQLETALNAVSSNINRLIKGPKNSNKAVRFIWIPGTPLKQGFFYESNNLLHQSMITKLFNGLLDTSNGAKIDDLFPHIRGGMLIFEYDLFGSVMDVRIVQDYMTLSTSKNEMEIIALSNEEKGVLLRQFYEANK